MPAKKSPKTKPEKPAAAPEWSTILKLREQLESQLRDGRKVDSDMVALYDKTYKVVVPDPEIEDFEPVQYHSGVPGETVDRYVGFLDAKPVISIEAGIGPDAQTRAENGERFLNTFLWASERRRGKWWEPTRQDSVKVGRGVVMVLPMPKWWTEAEGYPVKDSEEAEDWKKTQLPPILIRQLPATCVLDVTSSSLRILRALIVLEEPLAEVVSKWGDKVPVLKERLDKSGISPAEPVEVLMYVDATYFIVGVKHAGHQGIVEEPFPHGMGVCPLALFAGKTTGSRKPGKQWKSVLFDAAENLQLADELTSRKATVVRMFPIPQPWMRIKEGTNTSDRKGRPSPLEMNPKKMLMLWEGEETGFLYPEGELPEAESLTMQLREDRQTTLLPDIAAGLDISSTSPAWTVRQRSEMMTRGTLLPIAMNLVAGAEQLAELILRAIMSPWIGEKVYVRPEGGPGTKPLGIGPDEARGFIDRITATMNVQGPIDRNQDFALARMGWKELELPWEFCIQDLAHLEDPFSLWRRRQIEDVMRSEPYRTKLVEDALAEAELIERKEQIATPEVLQQVMGQLPPAAQQAIAGMGAPVPTGTPEGPPVGVPGGEGHGGVYPEGASPLAAAPVNPLEIRGPSPLAPMPGGPEIV